VYYAIIPTDVILRLTWIFTIAPESFGITISADLYLFCFAVAECTRRFLWNFFRMENESASNCGKFRAVADVPLPYSDEIDASDELRETNQSLLRRDDTAVLRKFLTQFDDDEDGNGGGGSGGVGGGSGSSGASGSGGLTASGAGTGSVEDEPKKSRRMTAKRSNKNDNNKLSLSSSSSLSSEGGGGKHSRTASKSLGRSSKDELGAAHDSSDDFSESDSSREAEMNHIHLMTTPSKSVSVPSVFISSKSVYSDKGRATTEDEDSDDDDDDDDDFNDLEVEKKKDARVRGLDFGPSSSSSIPNSEEGDKTNSNKNNKPPGSEISMVSISFFGNDNNVNNNNRHRDDDDDDDDDDETTTDDRGKGEAYSSAEDDVSSLSIHMPSV
jgi:hypothetical protein